MNAPSPLMMPYPFVYEIEARGLASLGMLVITDMECTAEIVPCDVRGPVGWRIGRITSTAAVQSKDAHQGSAWTWQNVEIGPSHPLHADILATVLALRGDIDAEWADHLTVDAARCNGAPILEVSP